MYYIMCVREKKRKVRSDFVYLGSSEVDVSFFFLNPPLTSFVVLRFLPSAPTHTVYVRMHN